MPHETTNLELLILACVQRSLATPYDLHATAGLSVGATIPGLARLEQRGLVKGVPGPRRSRRFSLTSAGQRALDTGVRDLGRDMPRDFESVLRIGALLCLYGSRQRAGKYLRRAALEWRRRARLSRAELEAPGSSRRAAPTANVYSWMKRSTVYDRLNGEASSFRRVASSLR